MNVQPRRVVGVWVLAIILALGAVAQAQALKQLPADAWVVFKLNNPQAVNQKVGALTQKLGLAQFDPAFADPLTALKGQLHLGEGFDDKGEFVVAMYPPAQGDDEPRFIALVPVTDYQTFTKTLANAKTEGELTTFTMPDEDDTIFAANRGSFAAISPWKELVSQKPAGIEVAGLAAKQLQSQDFVVYANVKVLGAMALPEVQGNRGDILQAMEQGLAREGQFNQKYIPAIKAVVNQVLNLAERALQEGQGATLGFTISDAGINSTFVGEFEPNSYLGKTVGTFKNAEGDMLTGLPSRKYFAFGGGVIDPEATAKLIDEMVGPIEAELNKLPEAKPLMDAIAAAKTSITSMNEARFGYVAPTGAPGQEPILQQVIVINGDAAKVAEAQRASMAAGAEMMKMMLPKDAATVSVDIKPGAKTVDGVALDQVNMQFKFDANTPEGAQVKQMMDLMYGPGGMNGFIGAVNDKTFITVLSGNEELLAATVKSAKAQETDLGQAAHIKSVTAQLPTSRCAVYYISLDNIANEVLKFMAQMGAPIQIKIPADTPPVGVSFGTEGSAFRVDLHLSTELISNMVSAGFQAFQMMQGGGAPPPGRL